MSDTVCESSENVNLILCSKLDDVTQEDLRNVSRAGIIYTSEVELGWMPIAQTFSQSRDMDGAMLQQIFEKYSDKTLACIKRECKLKMPISDISYLTTCTALIGSPLKHPTCHQPSEAALERVVIYALLQSPAGVLEENEDRAEVVSPPNAVAPYTDCEFDQGISAQESEHVKIPGRSCSGTDPSSEVRDTAHLPSHCAAALGAPPLLLPRSARPPFAATALATLCLLCSPAPRLPPSAPIRPAWR